MKDDQIEYFIHGFIEAMLFATPDEDDHALEVNYTIEDVEDTARDSIKKDCLSFIKKAGDLLDSGDLEQHGQDFFFERQGHGVGFRDRDLEPKTAKKLSVIAHKFPEIYVFELEGEICI